MSGMLNLSDDGEVSLVSTIDMVNLIKHRAYRHILICLLHRAMVMEVSSMFIVKWTLLSF